MVTFYRVWNARHAQITEVIPGLYISGICALTSETMKKYGITLIVNATHEVPNSKSLGDIPRIKLWLKDDTDARIFSHLEIICNQIFVAIAKGGRVLVHSVQGISRCATIGLAYLTKYKCKSLKDAFLYLNRKRPKVDPNIGFWRQLISFEQDLSQTMGSVKVIRDENDTTKLIPDIYRNRIVTRREKMQTDSAAENDMDVSANDFENSDDIEGHASGSYIKELSMMDGNHQAMKKSRSELVADSDLKRYVFGARLQLTSPTMEKRKFFGSTVVNQTFNVSGDFKRPFGLFKNRSRKNLLRNKFQPVLETLTEVVDGNISNKSR